MDDLEAIGYADAMAELHTILDSLEHDDIDVDRLAAHVARARSLIEACRARIAAARVDVERIVVDGGGDDPAPD